MKGKILKTVIFGAALTLAIGCSPETNNPSNVIVSPTSQKMTSTLAAQTSHPTELQIVQTATPTYALEPTEEKITPTPEITKTPENNSQINESCVSLTSNIDGIASKAVLKQMFGEPYDGLFLMDLSSSQTILVGEARRHVSFAPDAHQLAYIDANKSELIILNAKGDLISSFPVPNSWQSVIQWIDDEHFLIENMPLHDDETYNPPASSIVFSISNTEYIEYTYGYPGQFYIGNGAPEWGPYYFTQSVYDPILSRVVFPASDNIGGFPLVIWDMEKQQEIVRFRSLDPNYGGLPQWTQNGSHVIVGVDPIFESSSGTIIENVQSDLPYQQGGTDLFRVSRDGEIERLTFLSTEYKSHMEEFTMSPDENFIAFWLILDLDYESSNWNTNYQLAVLNTVTGEIIDLCLSSISTPFRPVWSPDGNYLLVTTSDWEASKTEVLLIDMEQLLATKIAEQVIGVGWITTPEK